MGSCFEGLLERDTIVQLEFIFDGWFKNYNFFRFKHACMCHCPTVVDGQLRLTYNSANVRPSVINSLPYIFASFFYLQLHTMNTVSHGILLPQKVNKLKSCLNAKTLHSKWL